MYKSMKNILLVMLMAIVITPFAVSAHTGTGDTTNSQESGFMMMQQVEDQALGNELHEEMEDLMTNMMSGALSETETDRMVELMNQYPGPGSMMMGRMMGSGMFGSGFNSFNHNSMMGYGLSGFGGGIFMIFFWILVVIGIVALVKYTMSNTTKWRSSKSALDTLKERYAKGEIDKDEFEVKKKDLQ